MPLYIPPANIKYTYISCLAPTKDILDAYKKKEICWSEYEENFNLLLNERQVEKKIDMQILNNACLLCSEEFAEKCHRRLVAEYLKKYCNEIEIIHI